jgi:hypothetical protein
MLTEAIIPDRVQTVRQQPITDKLIQGRITITAAATQDRTITTEVRIQTAAGLPQQRDQHLDTGAVEVAGEAVADAGS